MQETVKQRLIKYLEHKKIGRNKFETLAGISLGYITNLKNAPKEQQLVKILQAAPDLDKVWLLTGEGEMIKPNGNNAVANGDKSVAAINSNVNTAPDTLMAERIKSLEALLAEKERLIKLYERMLDK